VGLLFHCRKEIEGGGRRKEADGQEGGSVEFRFKRVSTKSKGKDTKTTKLKRNLLAERGRHRSMTASKGTNRAWVGALRRSF